MEPNIKIGKLFGIQIGLSYSWFILFLLITFSLWSRFSSEDAWGAGTNWVVALTASTLFFLSLLGHEMAHSVLALAKGLPVRSITLFIFGGVSQIEKEAMSAATEFWVGVVGPVSSFVIGAGFLALSFLFERGSPVGAMLYYLWYINLGLAIFNMLPGYPMDGGRVLRAAVWAVTGDVHRATRTAAGIGRGLAYVMIVLGILRAVLGGDLISGLMLAFVGWFLLNAARSSQQSDSFEAAITGVHARDVMSTSAKTVASRMSLADFFDEHLIRTGNRCFIVAENGRLLGLLTPRELKAVPRDHWPSLTAGQAMKPFETLRSVEPGAELSNVLEVMEKDHVSQVPVVTDGHLEGLIRKEDILRFIETRNEFDGA